MSMHSPSFLNSPNNSYKTRQKLTNSISDRKLNYGNSFKRNSLSSRVSLCGRSNQSVQALARSEHHLAENYGLALPVVVNEALTFSERNSIVSVNCSNNSWAWAVYGRRLFVWQFKEPKNAPKNVEGPRTLNRRVTTVQCRELTLPHCDIGHKASLIKVFLQEGQQMASCLAVSPTGDVRFWPSIAHDDPISDSPGILEGQEFDFLLSISTQNYVLVTTTCSLVLLQINSQNGRYTMTYKSLKPPSGFFGGIGKKFASIIIGMNALQDKENKFLKITRERYQERSWLVTLLADRWIQRWTFNPNGSQQFIFEDYDVINKIRDAFLSAAWAPKDADLTVRLLDMQTSDSKIYILAILLTKAVVPQTHYTIVTFIEEGNTLKLINFNILKLGYLYVPDIENEIQIKFIINNGTAYIYTEKTIFVFNLGTASENDGDVEKIDFQSYGDKIMYATVCSTVPLFFTRINGFLSICSSDFDRDIFNLSYSSDIFTAPSYLDSTNQTILSPNTTAGNIAIYDLDPDEIYNANKDIISQIKAAFVYHVKGNNNMCKNILKDVLSSEEFIDNTESNLDKYIIKIAMDLADDIPSADPRWEQYENNVNIGLGSSNSLQILQQLREKNLAISRFVEFLTYTGLWDKLNAINQGGIFKCTRHILSDINEKIVAAAALKCAHNQNQFKAIIEETIQVVLEDRDEKPIGSLTNQDLFYVKTTKVEDIFQAFVAIAYKYVQSNGQPSKSSTILNEINSIVLLVLREIMNLRQNESEFDNLPRTKKAPYEYLIWTSSSEKRGLRDALLKLIEITLKNGARVTGDPEMKQKFYQQIVELIDFVLDGRKNYIDSISDKEKYAVFLQQYESQRRDLIFPLVEDNQYELAAKLAEKYHEFLILVVICDRTENQNRLESYIERYSDSDFSQFAINWHLKQNKQGDLFERFKTNQNALARFLSDHPSLAWLQQIFNGELNQAAKILYELAQNETELVYRKKTMLSLAKLCFLAGADLDTSVEESAINTELFLIEVQEQLPENILQVYEYDTKNPKVLKVEEMINILVSDENNAANEFDFRKALELLNYIEEPYDLRHKIWCTAILRDSWVDYDMNSPLDTIKEMLFFKLIDLCYLMDGEIENFLPSMESLINCSEIGSLSTNKSYQYLFKLGYEYIFDLYNKRTE